MIPQAGLRGREPEGEDRTLQVLEHVDQGISMVDADLRVVAFNRRFLELLNLPASLFNERTTFEDVVRFNARRGEYGPGELEEQVRQRVELARRFEAHAFERRRPDGTILEIRGNPVPGGGFVTTYTDVTARRREEHLQRLEHSVTRGFAEMPSASAALQAALRAICEAAQWECGRYLWIDAAAGLLRYGEAWGVPSPDIERYIEDSRSMVYAFGQGLVGTVWKTQQAMWVSDMFNDPRVARPGITRALGLRAALVAPVAGEGRPIGALIFHSRRVREPDARLLETVRTIGAQIGQYMQRALAEQAVRESETRFRSLTELSSDWYWEQDAGFRFTQFSGPGAAANASSGDPSVYLGKSRWDIADLEPLEGDWDSHRELLERHEPFRDERFRRRMADGSFRYMSVSGRPILGPAGEFRGYRGVARDITARTLAEVETRKTAAELRLVADSVPAMIAYHGNDLRYRFVNRRYAAFYGLATEQILGRAPSDIAGEHAWGEMRRHFERAAAGQGASFERRTRRADGSMRELSVDLVPHLDDAGGVLGIYGLILDVTRRRRAEKALLLRNRAVEASVNLIMITELTPEGQRIAYVNPAFERVTGYGAAEVLGRHPRFLYGEGERQAGVDTLRSAEREQREVTAQVRNYRKDGTSFWNELHVAPVRDDAGRVTHFVSVGHDVSERIRYQEEIERQANYDSLTKLPNRNLLGDRLTQAVAKAERTDRPLGVMYVDLDHLKRINDSLGHGMGDQVIAAIGRRIGEALRTGDTVARVSGDEFVILLPDLKRADDAALIAAKVQACVGAPLQLEAHDFVLTASIGIALHPRDGRDSATLLRNADAALYGAKEQGRNCFRFFAPDMNERMVRHLTIERALREALEKGEFLLQYQPVVRLATGEPVGAEALLRWRRSDGTTVPPAEFIPIAEESGLIVPIGRWALENAALQAAAWNKGRRTPFHVSVNLSARQFRDPGLLDSVRRAFQRAKVEPELIELEITESTVMQNAEDAAKTLRALKELGVRIAVDDFGTGYSSLAYLKRFPIDTLKIDRSFVKGLPDDAEDAALSGAVIDLARGLGLEVIAEGVETRGQARALAARRCRYAQGFLFGEPGNPGQAAPVAKRAAPRKPRRRA